jgi:hypothetical protein
MADLDEKGLEALAFPNGRNPLWTDMQNGAVSETLRRLAAALPDRPQAEGVKLPEIPDDDSDFTPDLARQIVAKYQELIRRLAAPAAIDHAPDHGGLSADDEAAIREFVTKHSIYKALGTRILADNVVAIVKAWIAERGAPDHGGAPAAGVTEAISADSVAEAMQDGKGFWRSCSGCHELNEGVPTGRYSRALKCHVGLGCHECGGVGAVWDITDYADMAASIFDQDAALSYRAQEANGGWLSDERIDAAICQWMVSDGFSADAYRQRMRRAISAAFAPSSTSPKGGDDAE